MLEKNNRLQDSRIIGKGNLHQASRLEGKVKNRGIQNVRKKPKSSK